jgi:IS6 family transposase
MKLGKSCRTHDAARRTLAGYEAMAMITKGQVLAIHGGDIKAQARFIVELLQSAA